MLTELFPGFALIIALGAYVAVFLLIRAIMPPIKRRVSNRWVSPFINFWLFHHLLISGALIVLLFFGSSPADFDFALIGTEWGIRILQSLLAVFITLALIRAIGAAHIIYLHSPYGERFASKGYLQLVLIIIYCFMALVVFAILTGQPVVYYVSGLGAIMAVLLLVFRDTILSVVSSFQIHNDKLVSIGDWIELASYGADGEVIDIALYTIKVQNWDKTIVTIPTREVTNGALVNWKGMERSGGRRIKRSISIDMSSVRFLTQEEIDYFSRFQPLCDYMENKIGDIEEYNAKQQLSKGVSGNPRRLTNLGTLRAYMLNYLKTHPSLNTDDFICLVRQLPPTQHGLPLEIYTFLKGTDWSFYESVQSDIFDHLLSMLGKFGLRVYQVGLLEGQALERINAPTPK